MQNIGLRARAPWRPARALSRILVSFLSILAVGPQIALAQRGAPSSTPGGHADEDNTQIYPLHVKGNIWVMGGEPGESNVVVQAGNQGMLVVDTGVTEKAQELLGQINRLEPGTPDDQEKADEQRKSDDLRSISMVIDTDVMPDHIGGNEVLREAGHTLLGASMRVPIPGVNLPGADVFSSLNLQLEILARGANGGAPRPLWPTLTENFDVYGIHFNHEAIQLFHPRSSNTDGNLMVLFRGSDVMATGDVVDMTGYPIIDTDRGGTIDGELVTLNDVLEELVSGDGAEGGTVVIPGHGHLADQTDIADYTNNLTIIRNRVQYYKNQGKSLQQVLALKPSWDFDQRWGNDAGLQSPQQFIEALYKTLPARGPIFSMKNEAVVPANATVSAGKAY